MERWADWLPLPRYDHFVTLGEGGTPLIESRRWPGVWFKAEFLNPTGSHKDRALALAATDALAKGARVLGVFSAGSTGLSAAAYAARAGLACAVLMSKGVAPTRRAALQSLGAHLFELDLPIDAGLAALARAGGKRGIYVASTTRAHNPVQAEAGRTLAYEIVQGLGEAPARIIVPTGGGGTLAALHAGFEQLLDAGMTRHLPQLIAVVPEHYDTLRQAWQASPEEDGEFFARPAPAEGPTILDKLAHAHPPDGIEALRALRRSSGRVLAVSDNEALAAVGQIGAKEGLYLEPSSAVVLCALERLHADGTLRDDGLTVALACGSGHRETHRQLQQPHPARVIAADEIETALGALA